MDRIKDMNTYNFVKLVVYIFAICLERGERERKRERETERDGERERQRETERERERERDGEHIWVAVFSEIVEIRVLEETFIIHVLN